MPNFLENFPRTPDMTSIHRTTAQKSKRQIIFLLQLFDMAQNDKKSYDYMTVREQSSEKSKQYRTMNQLIHFATIDNVSCMQRQDKESFSIKSEFKIGFHFFLEILQEQRRRTKKNTFNYGKAMQL